MIVRLVKMTFREGEVARFRELFEGWRKKIIAFRGCEQLELLQDRDDPRVFFTRSIWRGPADLEAYRTSTTFGEVWPVVKELFDAPPQAWTLEERVSVHRKD
jgi:quinol monooxygenase YgiN